jgi:hypothetical protein
MNSYENALKEVLTEHLKGMKVSDEVFSVPSVLRDGAKEISDMLHVLHAKEIQIGLLEGQETLISEGLVKDELRKAKIALQAEIRDKIKQIDHLKE